MPAYNFQERFIPMVMDRSKNQTIRAQRKQRPRVGQKAHLFTGMRTKWCRKLVDPSPDITGVKEIIIDANGIVTIDGLRVADFLLDTLAWEDGFRHADQPDSRHGCFEIMSRWWSATHALPFTGDLIIWTARDTTRACRVCGCTQDNCTQCILATGEPCHWVESNLCSRCQADQEAAVS